MSKPVLGLIGSIGAGKSAAAAILSHHGGTIIDADRIGHEVLDEPAIRDALVARWGERILQPNETVSRRAVAAIVFNDSAERIALENIVYPRIEALCREQIAKAHSRFVILDAAVLLEAGWQIADKLLYIDAAIAIRLQRVASRGWSEADLARREASQWPIARKRALADAVIENNGSLAELEAALVEQLQKWGWQ